MFDLLGIVFAREAAKAEPFSAKFRMLGLQLDLTSAASKRLFVWTHR